MLRFFRQIRQRLLTGNPPAGSRRADRFSKYLLYALGEIILVVIGILIALQINNWNQQKELRVTERKTLSSLITSLRKDSLELIRIIDLQSKSLNAQNIIINSSIDQYINDSTPEEISKLLFDVHNGAYSFFPKYGTYNSLVSNKGIDIINSDSIKSELIDLYDYWCRRYENVDNVVDKKYQNELSPFLQGKIGFFVNSDFKYSVIQVSRFKKRFQDLQLQCQNLNFLTTHSIIQLKNIQEKVNGLIQEIESELN